MNVPSSSLPRTASFPLTTSVNISTAVCCVLFFMTTENSDVLMATITTPSYDVIYPLVVYLTFYLHVPYG